MRTLSTPRGPGSRVHLQWIILSGLVWIQLGCEPRAGEGQDLTPIDHQVVQDQDDMTWADYEPIPGRNWADPALEPERGFKLAVMAIDFPDQPFVITMPKGSDPFGNPQVDPVPREEVSQFYADFFLARSEFVRRGGKFIIPVPEPIIRP